MPLTERERREMQAKWFPVNSRFRLEPSQCWNTQIRNDGTFRLPAPGGEYIVIRREIGMVQARRYKPDGEMDNAIHEFSLETLRGIVI